MANLSNINNILRTGSLGVGINRDPLGAFEISSATKPGIKMFNTAASGKSYEAYSDANGNYIIYDQDADDNRFVINTSGNATFAGDVTSQGYTIDAAGLQTFQDFQSKPIDTDSGLFTVGGNGMQSGYTRAVSMWSSTDGVWNSWVGTNLRWDGSNFKRASDDGGQNWGNIAGIRFLGNGGTSGAAMQFIIDPPEQSNPPSGEQTIGTTLPASMTALSLNNDLSATFAGAIGSGAITSTGNITSTATSFVQTFNVTDNNTFFNINHVGNEAWAFKCESIGGGTADFITIGASGGGKVAFGEDGGAIFEGLVSGITPTAAANFTTKAYVDSFDPPTGTTQFFNQSNSYNNFTRGITGYGNVTMDTSVSYYDTGKQAPSGTNWRGIVWTGKHYIITGYIANKAFFVDNNFNSITNPEASSITLPLASGLNYPHGAGWDGRYLYCIQYNPGTIVVYDLDNGTTTATIVNTQALSNTSETYEIEYAEGHLYTCADGKVSKYKVEGKTITHVFTSANILSGIEAQAITYDGSYLWITQNGNNAFKVSLDCVLVATITTGLPPNNIGWAWNGQNIATVNFSTGDIYILNTAETRFDTEKFLLMGGNVGIGGSPSVSLEIAKAGARMKMIDGTNQLNMGLWDGANYRFEGDANRPMFFTSYQGNINFGISGGTTMSVQSGGVTIGATAVPATKLDVILNDAATNTVANVIRVSHTTTGTPAIGLGAGISFSVERVSSSVNLSRAAIYGTNGTVTAQEGNIGDFVIHTRTDTGPNDQTSGMNEKFRITGRGNIGQAVLPITDPYITSGDDAEQWQTYQIGKAGVFGAYKKNNESMFGFNTYVADGGSNKAIVSALNATATRYYADRITFNYLSTTAATGIQSAQYEIMRLTDSRKVGIGTTSPSTRLSVTGSEDGALEFTTTLGSTKVPSGTNGSLFTAPRNKTILTGYSTVYTGVSGGALAPSGFLQFNSGPGWTGSQRNWAITSGYDIGGTQSGGGGNKLAILVGNSQNFNPELGNDGAVGANTGDGVGTSVACYWDNTLNMNLSETSRIRMGGGGSATDPMLTPLNDKNTGIWYPTSDTWAVSTGGAEKFRISNSAQSLRVQGGAVTGSNYMQFVNSAGTSQGYFGYGGASNILYIVQQVAGDIAFYTNGAVRGSISQGGTLTMGGDVVAFGSPSDKKLKENIKPIESALDKVSKLQGVTFDWKDKEKEYDQFGKPHKLQEWKNDIGFIAQDVQKVVPELVRENEDGMLSMRHQGIAPILLEAIKDLKAEIEELKNKPCNCNNCNCNK